MLNKFKKTKKLLTKEEEYELYAEVSKQLAQGKRDEGVWTKAFADSEGDKNKTEAIYIDLMVEKLVLSKKSELEIRGEKEKEEGRKKEKRRKEHQEERENKQIEKVYKKFPKTINISFFLILPVIAYTWWFSSFWGGLFMGLIAFCFVGLVVLCLRFFVD